MEFRRVLFRSNDTAYEIVSGDWSSDVCSPIYKLGLTGEEIVTIRGLTELAPRKQLIVEMYRPSDGRIARFPVRCRIDTPTELEYFRNGGVLNYVLRNLAKGAV